jgi:hypothetical protein
MDGRRIHLGRRAGEADLPLFGAAASLETEGRIALGAAEVGGDPGDQLRARGLSLHGLPEERESRQRLSARLA